jgi:virulence-associated protein VapD
MITKRTVLVLGAGASMPYGFPSGETLIEEIKNELNAYTNKNSISSLYVNASTNNLAGVLLRSGFNGSQINHFVESLKDSSQYSIDSFLEHRVEFIEIGKMSIAYLISQHEQKSLEFLNSNIDIQNQKNWYKYLWNIMKTSFESMHSNLLTIITFNYDRSFEYFLYIAIKGLYGKEHEACKDLIKKFPILHVHGCLGDIFSKANLHTNYGVVLNDATQLKEVSASIKIVHDKIDEAEMFKSAREYIEAATYVYFLGFGYGTENVERLKLKKSLSFPSIKKGTAYGLTDHEIRKIKANLENKLDIYSEDCIGLLRNHAFF